MSLDKFKNYLEINGNSPATVDNYAHKVSLFLAYMGDKKITEDLVTEYLFNLKQKSTESTVNLNSCALRKYFTFIKITIQLPKQLKKNKTLPDSMTEDYFLNHILAEIYREFPNPLHVKAVLSFLFYTGVRKSELFSLARKDIDLTSNRIKIYEQKKKMERIIIIPPKLNDILTEYFDSEDENLNALNISRGILNYIMKRLKPRCTEVNLRPHLFRHSFATHFLQNGFNIVQVKELLGHENINSTLRYTSVNLDELQEKINKVIG